MREQDVITIKIGKNTRHVKVPSTWDDLDDRTAMLFYNILFSNVGDEFTRGVFTAVKLISLTQHLLGLSPEMMAVWEGSHKEEHGDVAFLEELRAVVHAALGGLFDIEEDEETGATGYAVKFNRTRNAWPSLTHTPHKTTKTGKPKPAKKTTWYFAPADGLENITIYELAMSFARYEAYLNTRDDQHANALIGILYRPSRPVTTAERQSDWRGDRRLPLRQHEGTIEKRAQLAATLPALCRRFIVFWFAGCREAIVKQYPRVFKQSETKTGGGDWGALLLSLAESGTFGALGETSDQHFSNALKYLSMKDEEAERMRLEIEKNRKKR